MQEDFFRLFQRFFIKKKKEKKKEFPGIVLKLIKIPNQISKTTASSNIFFL